MDNMELVTEKVVKNGQRMRRIVAIRNMMKPKDIPDQYFDGCPRLEKMSTNIYCLVAAEDVRGVQLARKIILGQLIYEETFEALLVHIRGAGERLHSLKKEQDRSDKVFAVTWGWHGEEVFTI